jgi:hypothetical protein
VKKEKITPVGRLIDEAYAFEQKIKRHEAKVKRLKELLRKKEARILRRLEIMEVDTCKGKVGVAGAQKRRTASIKDRNKFLKYVQRKKAWDLLTNHVNQKAYFDRLEDKETVPGVGIFEFTKLSLTKRGK